ncbi:hypothetical protein HGP14_09570 [Rhizobium sp. P32RR-XVIII]|uniref:hypothetical protein n=1 Tax=Rhizobium sp. P32RR-XVIII TaxID=2726738 RepID=UPI0014577433|nr:hypothetical protein [Rhizobium sp. P32RR-XVIII]NLS03606.1 hypothetical protein [Rhizobium sp. P32RR-XVIII]
MVSFASVGPRVSSRAAWIEYPYTQADKNGWGAERLAEERKAFWATMRTPTARDITEAEETQGWLSHVPDESERRCLTAWAWCSARKRFFKDWCREEGIHPETGRRRKERAILRILLVIGCKPLQHNEIDINALLPDDPEISDKDVIIAEGATHWRDAEAKPTACDFDMTLERFDWAEAQNARRRQREARRKQAA